MNCKLCNSGLLHLLYRLSQGYKIIGCRNCGLKFLYPIPSKESLLKIYEKDYFDSWGKNYESLKRLKELSYESIFREVERFIVPGCFLDVGCAFGYSFEVAIRRGWNPYGVEISPEAYMVVEERFPLKVILGDFSQVELRNNFFDLVVMFDFLEHTYNLMDAMVKAYNILKPEGILAIVTPDIDSFTAKLMRRNWIHIKLEHTFYFSTKTLKLLFIKTGFNPIIFKNFWKAINFSYLKSQIKKYGATYQSLILKLLDQYIPDYLQRFNISIPQGEILGLARKV